MKISVIICLQVNNFFHFLGNLNYYHLPGKYSFFLFREICFHSWEISIVTFYQALYHFHFRGTHFNFLGNLNYYLLPGKYPFPTSGELVSTPWEISIISIYRLIQFSTSGKLVSTSGEISIITFYQVNTLFSLLGNSLLLPGKSQLVPYTR